MRACSMAVVLGWCFIHNACIRVCTQFPDASHKWRARSSECRPFLVSALSGMSCCHVAHKGHPHHLHCSTACAQACLSRGVACGCCPMCSVAKNLIRHFKAMLPASGLILLVDELKNRKGASRFECPQEVAIRRRIQHTKQTACCFILVAMLLH